MARGGEVVDPDEIKHPRAERAGDVNRAILTASVQDNDLIEQTAHRLEGPRKVFFSSRTIMVKDTRVRSASAIRRNEPALLVHRASDDRLDRAFPFFGGSFDRVVRHFGPAGKAARATRTPRGVESPHLAVNFAVFSSRSLLASIPFPTKVRLPK